MVRVVSVADVACANTQTAASKYWLWRLVMNSLLTLKERGGMWLRKHVISDNVATTCKDPLRR